MTPAGLLSRLPHLPRKVVVLRAPRIGDFISATPALRALRAGLPDAQISLISLPMLADLVARLSSVDRFLPFPGFPGIADQLFDPRRTVQFLTAMQSEHFDLALQLHGSGLYSNPFTLLLGARFTAGFVRPGDPAHLLDASLAFPSSGREADRLLALTDLLGFPRQGADTEFPLLPADQAAARALLEDRPQPYFAIHPYAHSSTRRWSLDRFAALGKELLRGRGGTILVLAGPEQAALAQSLAASIGPAAVSLAGRASLPVTGALLARCAAFVTNDSGPAHIAYALRVPTVTVWGGEDLERYGPPEKGPFRVLLHPVDCRPCHVEPCPIGYVCLENITVQQVISTMDELLA